MSSSAVLRAVEEFAIGPRVQIPRFAALARDDRLAVTQHCHPERSAQREVEGSAPAVIPSAVEGSAPPPKDHPMRIAFRLSTAPALIVGSVATLGAQSASAPVHTRTGNVTGIAGQRPGITA